MLANFNTVLWSLIKKVYIGGGQPASKEDWWEVWFAWCKFWKTNNPV